MIQWMCKCVATYVTESRLHMPVSADVGNESKLNDRTAKHMFETQRSFCLNEAASPSVS